MECCKCEMRVLERRREDGREVLVFQCPICKKTETKEIHREEKPETPAF